MLVDLVVVGLCKGMLFHILSFLGTVSSKNILII